jgi:hypothetical protein
VKVTVTSQARLFTQVERREGAWAIVRLSALYFQDAMAADVPGHFPALDPERLVAYRPSYRFLSYLLAESGKTARPNLAGIDRPDLCAVLYEAQEAWLGG